MSNSIDTRILPQLESIIRDKEGIFDVAIIGGGPAGLTAGIYCARAGFKTIMVEKAILGGQLSEISEIENYPGFPSGITGVELSARLEDQAKKFGVEIVWADVVSIETAEKTKKVILSDGVISASSIIIATGTEPKKMNIPGESEFRGRGVSYCATCDGAFYRDKVIAVIGGGNSAISEAIFLTRFAAKVYVIHRRDKLRADKILADRAMMNEKMEFVWDSVPEKIAGASKVEAVQVKNVINGSVSDIKVDGVFIYIGELPNVKFFGNAIKKDKDGFIIVDQGMKTSVEGVFAAGDVTMKQLRQIATAVSDGAIAAHSCRKHLENMI